MANERKEIERERLSEREREKEYRETIHTHTQIDRYLYGTLIDR